MNKIFFPPLPSPCPICHLPHYEFPVNCAVIVANGIKGINWITNNLLLKRIVEQQIDFDQYIKSEFNIDLTQTYIDLTDNHSTTNTLEILEKFKDKK